ncbi:MAG TPA: hypothetical protein DCE11_05525 [Ruminiclostridium sp.]|nr:hypothetical protein [Ruminiclostridium sp.]
MLKIFSHIPSCLLKEHSSAGPFLVLIRCIFISVTDNGQGIPPDILPNIIRPRSMENTTAFSGIGLSNVDSRIKMLFGNDYGLYIDSIYQMYTTVEIVLTEYKRRREAL